jgi:predicted RNA polymerase sigma factor
MTMSEFVSALMCLNAARLPARSDAAGDLVALSQQDRARWDAQLVLRGLELFDSSRAGAELSAYHVEAAIAVAHASATSFDTTDWKSVVVLYDRLMSIAASPVVALHRAIAIGQRDGAASGLAELEAISDAERLCSYPFYPAARGDFELRLGRHDAARRHFRAALALARNDAERRFLQKRLAAASE